MLPRVLWYEFPKICLFRCFMETYWVTLSGENVHWNREEARKRRLLRWSTDWRRMRRRWSTDCCIKAKMMDGSDVRVDGEGKIKSLIEQANGQNDWIFVAENHVLNWWRTSKLVFCTMCLLSPPLLPGRSWLSNHNLFNGLGPEMELVWLQFGLKNV